MKTSPASNQDHYVPCLRWKMGEYQALFRLPPETKAKITPLIEVAEMGWDFEKKQLAKSIDGHLEDVAKNISTKWGKLPAFVDLKHISQFERMKDGTHPVNYLFKGLRAKGVPAIPVTDLVRDLAYQTAVKDAVDKDRNGVCLRVTLLQIHNKDFGMELAKHLKFFGVSLDQIDLIVDLEAPAFDPIEGFTRMVKATLDRLPNLSQWRTFTVLGTSFPANMGQLIIGSQSVQRKEWLFYKTLLQVLEQGERIPMFGDYVIAHPALIPKDPRLMKPSATIRYAIDDAWIVIKGKNLRDNGNHQYKGFCRDLISTSVFSGKGFSAGDEFIVECAAGARNPGNLSTWRWVGTNHHLEKICSDLSSLHAF